MSRVVEVPPGEMLLATTDQGVGVEAFESRYVDHNKPGIEFLTACLVRMDADPRWAESMRVWMRQRRASAEKTAEAFNRAVQP